MTDFDSAEWQDATDDADAAILERMRDKGIAYDVALKELEREHHPAIEALAAVHPNERQRQQHEARRLSVERAGNGRGSFRLSASEADIAVPYTD